MVTGEVDPFDIFVKQAAFARNAKPIFNYIKLNTIGVPVGQNFMGGESGGGGATTSF